MKFGSFSAILDKQEYTKYNNLQYYKKYKNIDNDTLFKITNFKENNRGEITYLDFLNNDNEYVMKIYKDTIIDIDINPNIMNYLKSFMEDCSDIFLNSLNYDIKLVGYFLEDCGSIDLFDTLTNLLNGESNIWMPDFKNRINEFIFQMCDALNYLERHKMCHFDIKPENIVYNNKNNYLPFGKRFKLIDFGFAEKYPFDKYVNKWVGTHFYVPYNFINKEYPLWAMKIQTNDWKYNPVQRKNYHYTTSKDSKYSKDLVYKTDVYSMGITFNQLMYYIDIYLKDKGMTLVKINKNKNNLYNIIRNMTHKDIELRFNSGDCIKFLNDCDKNLFDDNEVNDDNNIVKLSKIWCC
jgi:serine/threonine protein kinase